MERECITVAPTVEEAVDAALEELGVQQDAVEYEVLESPGKAIFGLGSDKQARVRVWIRQSYLEDLEEAKKVADEVLDLEVEPATTQAAAEAAPEEPELSDEDLDKVADTAVTALKQTLAHLGLPEPTIEEYEGDEGEIILDIIGGELGILIGRHGRTLDALQTAVGAITTRQLGFRYPVVVDVEGYRHRRRQKIEDIARRGAERAAKHRQDVRLRPMTSFERRVVHVALRSDARVVTSSEGQDPYRQVVISPK
ncbi:MAG: RNA-binding cell elongation regulator Jag/EloR [Coriobacteriia bacterium]|nr:RNA-binding cell elongation regulator Jag/EloR [Coriobacteriia bacterium]